MSEASIESIETIESIELPAGGGLTAAALGAEARDYLALLKPRVMTLVVFTGVAGMVLAPGALHPVLAAVAVICIAVGAGASGAINMWYDRDIDAVMRRTADRPIPAGRVTPDAALGFGIVMAVGAVTVMGLAVNHLAAGLLALTIAFYVLVYTMWLKRRTPENIVIGGAAGALPPMIGWAAVSGEVGLAAGSLFLIIFLWTPPHFWALALYRSDDYRAAGVPMLPVVAGDAATRRRIVLYTLALAPAALAPWLLGVAGPVFALGAAVLSVLFVVGAARLQRDRSERAARQLFGFSILHLFLLFGLLMFDRLPVVTAAVHG